MPSLGLKRKENLSKMDKVAEGLPQLSNEMQLRIMNRVKKGELSIDDALNQARRDRVNLLKQQSLSNEDQLPSQYNFSIHKYNRYRWQKRILQIDFKTKMLCSIERGIIKRQLPFSTVKSCDDGVGSKFSISFKEHHDYELEATSLQDKHKIMQLVNQIIYGNIYIDPEEDDAESSHSSPESRSLREGMLLLHRGGLASFKWVKYEAQLHPGQLTLFAVRQRILADGEGASMEPVSTVIHLSHGDTRVQKLHANDTFTLTTHKNEYQFKVPMPDQVSVSNTVQEERDAWVQAIDKLCSEWKRKSRSDQVFVEQEILRPPSIPEDAEENRADLESSSGCGGVVYPPPDHTTTDPTPTLPTSQTPPLTGLIKPIPKPRTPKTVVRVCDVLEPSSSLTSTTPVVPSSPSSPLPSTGSVDLKVSSMTPSSPVVCIPPPPPMSLRLKSPFRKPRTKGFHWDVVGSDKITKSFWLQEGARKADIDTSRLLEQFAVKDVVTLGPAEPSNSQNIMLNQKIAHNFNIFLKSFPVQPWELKDKLFIIDERDGGLSDEHITSLRRYVPTMDDVEMYKSYKGPVTELHIVDQYMMEMCNVPYLSAQLDLLLALRELPSSMNDLQPLINQKIRMCAQLDECRSFASVLQYLLAIGNYLNENAGKEKATGFRLSSLTKLSQLRGRDRKFTLLHALVEQIMLHEPNLASFTQELAEFETVPGASIKGLTAEVDVLKNELQKISQFKKASKKRSGGARHSGFQKDLEMVVEKYKEDFASLTKKCDEMKKLYSAILVQFGEPADRDSKEFFGVISQFLHDFRRAHAEAHFHGAF
ncbi:Formin-H [Oryzias melastigma]|uniref:Formin-H n=1 Tax=Oryzias melastigma TaxID=30732 RepID=A0A3B3CFJ2_ORYME|nr:formin-like protein 13 [Oryzias melastigma]KAF6737076.1 Formin-H [Oryzias melastigma]